MKWWQTAWSILRDVGLTGTGLYLVISQVQAPHPSDVIVAAGLALVFPAAATHAAAVLPGRSAPPGGPPSSSPPAPSPSPSPSSPAQPGKDAP